ncbi:FtsX-like permease family protein [Actinomadura harenae]|uniref:FtsX-like permease family protein n=1 Tax=Actinomadura harenae TaxID=2483351 RepID=A0A3M2LXP2_9ACTN|nr:FtsX-like permease family protein [Actinomadura harenae]RMI42211.1 FtsX-like permease family protein [Actinomadura harenae]
MRTTLGLSWRLLRGGGRRGLLGSLLTLAAVAVSTGLLLFAVGANHAFAARSAADAWRHPAKAHGTPTAIEALTTDGVRGKPVTVVELAALSGDAPVPPGMKRFPKAGEVWTSPALRDLMRTLPADQLSQRFPTRTPTGTLGRAAVAHPGELVAVVGHAASDPSMTAARSDAMAVDNVASPTRIDRYGTGSQSSYAFVYQMLAAIASVLMVVPLLVFGGAAARLTVARRDQRLAALRLVGATPGQVVGITTAEAVLTAAAGAVLGTVLFAAALPALTQITIGGGTWYASDLWPGVWTPLVLLAVPVLVGLSAVVGLRRVVVSPLGVARRATPPALRAVRPLAFLAIVIAFGLVAGSLTSFGRAGLVILLVFLALAFIGINLVGPWIVALIGRVAAGTARGPARLLAGRRLMDDPRSAWRTVAGIALTGFVAGFLALLNPSAAMFHHGSANRLEILVPSASAEHVASAARDRLRGLPAKVTVEQREDAAGEGRVTTVRAAVDGAPADVDRARTALTGLVPGHTATTPADADQASTGLLGDLRTGALTVLGVSFLIAITSAGITGASAVLDRRQTYAMLRLAGTPLEVLDRARRQETLIPLAVMGGGSLLTGLFFGMPFAVDFGYSGALTLAGFLVVGFGGIIGAGALSRPLLRAVTTDPTPRPD